LLPFQYEKEDGSFLFEKFFSEELLKLYTYAEKLAIYLTPYVLRVDLRVVFYDYGNDCNIQTKEFPSPIEAKLKLCVLYRKAHYDITYDIEYFFKYSNYLTSFSQDVGLSVVTDELIDYYSKNNEVNGVDLKQSKIFNKNEKRKKRKRN